MQRNTSKTPYFNDDRAARDINPRTPAPVVIDNTKPINKGSLKAFASVTIAGRLTIHSVRIIEQAGPQAWVAAAVLAAYQAMKREPTMPEGG